MVAASLRTRWGDRTRMSAGERTATTFASVLLLASLVGVVARYRPPGSLYSLGVTAVSPYLRLAGVPAAILFLRVRRPFGRVGAAVCLVPTVWLVALQAPTFVAQTAPADGVDVTVMTANLKAGQADPAAVVAAVREHDVAVLMIEELTPDVRVALHNSGLDRILPYSIADTAEGGSGTGAWSRYPFVDTHVATDIGFGFVTTHVRFPGVGALSTIVAMHIYGPHPSAQFPGWRRDMARYPGILQALSGASVIVGGDFNSTIDTPQFRAFLSHGYADAAAQAGAGYTPTWPADQWFPPVIAIDHVLTRGAVARTLDSIEIPGSDHRALVATIRIPRT